MTSSPQKSKALTFEAFRQGLRQVLPVDDKPVLIYVSATAFLASFQGSSDELPEAVFQEILAEVGPHRTLIMPAFTDGSRSKLVNLDLEPSRLGRVTELFRKHPGTLRTASRFYSYCVAGPGAEELAALCPVDVWGDGSVLAWAEQNDAHVIMAGRSWLECDLFHRAEWLAQVPYRYTKPSDGQIKLNGQVRAIQEKLFVRRLVPWLLTEWAAAVEPLRARGARSGQVGRTEMMSLGAQAIVSVFTDILKKNPFQFVGQNAEPEADPLPISA